MEAKTDARLRQNPPAHAHIYCYLINMRPWIFRVSSITSRPRATYVLPLCGVHSNGYHMSCVTPFSVPWCVSQWCASFLFLYFMPHIVILHNSCLYDISILYDEYEHEIMHQIDRYSKIMYGTICTRFILKLWPGTTTYGTLYYMSQTGINYSYGRS